MCVPCESLQLHLATIIKQHLLSNDTLTVTVLYVSPFCRHLCEILIPLWNVKISVSQEHQLMRLNMQMPDEDDT